MHEVNVVALKQYSRGWEKCREVRPRCPTRYRDRVKGFSKGRKCEVGRRWCSSRWSKGGHHEFHRNIQRNEHFRNSSLRVGCTVCWLVAKNNESEIWQPNRNGQNEATNWGLIRREPRHIQINSATRRPKKYPGNWEEHPSWKRETKLEDRCPARKHRLLQKGNFAIERHEH